MQEDPAPQLAVPEGYSQQQKANMETSQPLSSEASRRNLNVYKTQTPHLFLFVRVFFNILAYNVEVSLSMWISW